MKARHGLAGATGVQAVLEQRARFHLLYRLMVRINLVAIVFRGGKRGWQPALKAAAWIGGDVLTATMLRRSSRPLIPPRLTVDAADAATWSLELQGPYDAAVLTGVPLAIEAGLEGGFTALLVPLANTTVTAGVRARLRRPLGLFAFWWQVMGVVGGVALRRYGEQRRRALKAESEQQLQAERSLAFLNGQNQVAMGADSVVDLLERTTPLLQILDEPTTQHTLAQWKAALAETTGRHSTYLGMALLRWERQHNDHPDLSADVHIMLGEGNGTVLLTEDQAGWLHRSLDAMQLRGVIDVQIVDPGEASRAGRARDLIVGQRLLPIPADPHAPVEPFDPGPLVLALGAVWFLCANAKGQGEASPRVTVPLAGGLLAASGWAHRAIERRGAEARSHVLRVAVASSITYATLVTPTVRRPFTTEGWQALPGNWGLLLLATAAAVYRNTLEDRDRKLLWAGALVTELASLGQTRDAIRWRHVMFSLGWPMTVLKSGSRLSRAFQTEAARLAAELDARADEVFDAACGDGREFVLSLVEGARTDAWRRYERLAATAGYDSSLLSEARRRLEEVDRRLEKLR